MSARILSPRHEVREAAQDAKAVERRMAESVDRGWEWRPALAEARAKVLELSLKREPCQEFSR